MVKVRATERGHYGKIREPGDVFEVPDSLAEKGASWFEVVGPGAAPDGDVEDLIGTIQPGRRSRRGG